MHPCRRGVALAATALLMAGAIHAVNSMAGGTPAAAASAAAGSSAVAPDERQSVTLARASGERVEVLSERTENRQVFANADGTFTSETAALPERVRRDTGWVDVDTTLAFAGDGSVRPAATPLDLAFSGGGTAPLATIGDGSRSVVMSWPGPLPKPVLDKDTATYASVLPDVDLKVTASVLGYSEVLVVKTREAAANPALATLRFATRGTGATVRETEAGGLSAVTDSGVTLFHSPAPRMWDSSGTLLTRPLAVAPKLGGRQSVMGVDAKPGEVVLTPDAKLLTGSDTKFPVYIDPQWSGYKQAWTYVDRAFPNQEYWNSSHMPEAGNYGSGVKRSFFRMDSNNVNGRHILKGTFRITQAKSWGCTSSPQAVQLYLTTGISSSTTWNHQPSWSDWQDSVSSDAGYDSAECPDAPIEFNVTSAVVKAAKAGWASTTFGLKDYDDTNSSGWGWKGFNNSPRLVIDYNSVPAVPSGISTSPGTPCVVGAGRPSVNAGTDPLTSLRLKAMIYDPDKSNDSVRAEFMMHHFNTGTGAWDDVTASLPGGGKTAYKAAKVASDHDVALSNLVDGDSYAFRVKAYDGTDSSGWSKWCEFTVDTSDPGAVPKVSSIDYPADTPDEWHGGVGKAGAFTLSPGDGESDVTAFRFALEDPDLATAATQVSIPAGKTSVTVSVAPRHGWLNSLFVLPVDRAGNVGKTSAVYDFYVAAGAGPVGEWHLEETSGTTVADSAAVPHPVTLSGGTSWTGGGRIGGAVRMDGTTGYGSTSGPVVHTDRGMTVSAWVRLADATKNSTVVSQAGAHGSGFQLYYSSGYKRWIFNKYDADTDDEIIVRAIGDSEPQLNVWTHLVGVYDAPARQIRLYVNGRLQSAPAAYPYTPWDATGPLQFGRTRVNSAYAENFAGDIDDLKVWDRILSDDPASTNEPDLGNEIAALAKQPPDVQGLWSLDEGTGTTAGDSSRFGRNATINGGATWSDDGHDGGTVLKLNGVDAYAGAASPVRTDHSYTVSAYVRITGDDTCALPAHNLTAVAQDGARHSGFYLGYRKFTENGATVYRWSFAAPGGDADGTTWTYATSAEPIDCSVLDTWTLLTGVYDEVAKEIRLYVNGGRADSRTFTSWQAGGPIQIGRAKYKGVYGDFLAGDVDDVRVWAGALTKPQALNLAMGQPLGD